MSSMPPVGKEVPFVMPIKRRPRGGRFVVRPGGAILRVADPAPLSFVTDLGPMPELPFVDPRHFSMIPGF